MEQVARATPDRALARGGWAALVLALGFAAALLVGGGRDLLLWSVTGVVAAAVPVALGIALCLLPGLALLRLLWRADLLTIAERLGLAVGLSVGLPPLCLLAVHVAGLRWSAGATWGYLLISAVIGLWPAHQPREWRARWAAHPRLDLPAGLLLGVTLTATLVRLYVVRDLPTGLWGDSYQHTMIAQLLVDNGGLFESWAPYAPLTTFTYHYGFHANVAFFHWLTGVDVPHSLVWIGQALNAASVPLAYLLVARLSGDRWAGVWAALITGMLSTMPGYYVNWGRYTQLAGQVELPALIVCWAGLLDAERRSWRQITLAGVTTAGLLCTHYRVAVFAACFLAGYGLVLLARRHAPRQIGELALRGAVAAALGVALATPWLLNVRNGQLVRATATVLANQVNPDLIALANALPVDQLFTLFVSPYLLALALGGAVLAFWKRDWRMASIAIWPLLTLLATNPNLIGLPGAGLLTNFAALLASYLVIAPLAGYAIAWAQRKLARYPAATGAIVLTLIGLCAWGAAQQAQIVDSKAFMLLTPADARALAWVRAHTPADARFLVNSMAANQESVSVGTDGGWWMPLLGRRASTVPPMTYVSEVAETPDYVEQVNRFGKAIRAAGPTSAEGLQLLCAAGARYIYSGKRADAPERIDVKALAHSPLYHRIYRKDGVEIYEFIGVCPH